MRIENKHLRRKLMKNSYLPFMIILSGLLVTGVPVTHAQTNVPVSTLKDSTLYQDKFTVFPNPFDEQTTLSYNLLRKADVNLKICNILGQEIITLVNEFQSQGEKSVILNLSGINDAPGRPGVYYAILTAGFDRQVIKLFQAR